MMNDLLKKLKDAGFISSTASVESNTQKQPKKLESIYNGTWEMSDSGEVFVMQESIPFPTMHGKIAFNPGFDPSAILNLEKIENNPAVKPGDIAFIDIETSNLSFGAGSFVFLIGLCTFTENGVQSTLLFINHPGAEKALLEMFSNHIDHFQVISTYNGKSFDVPFLRNRFAFHHLDENFTHKPHIDLLHYARRLWKLRIESCKLSDVERLVLGLERDEVEIPGWLVPQMYFDYLSQNDPKMLTGIFYHNKNDVISLAALFQHMTQFLFQSPSNKKVDYRDHLSLALLYEKRGDIELAKHYYLLGLENAFDFDFNGMYCLKFGLLLKRMGEFGSAIAYWLQSANQGNFEACIELSKHYEHRVKDTEEALKWALEARKHLIPTGSFQTRPEDKIINIEHRIERLNRKKEFHEE